LGLSVADLQREFFIPHWHEIVVGRRGLSDHLRPALAKIAPDLSYDDFLTYWFENDARLNVALLDELRQQRDAGMKIYLATNQEHLRASYLLRVLGLGHQCDGIYYSAALGCRKPDRDFFERVAELAGFAAEQLLLIDDSLVNVAAARASGWNAVQWLEGSSISIVLAELGANQSRKS
jgi:putative hydrolase of the HAD superfamily